MGGTNIIHYYVSLVIPVNGKLVFIISLCALFLASEISVAFDFSLQY
jgi:hypothetical protein